ncbi:MAG: hypothetical protein WBS19_04035 [Candidatus Korobacteraceae bacterium]
MVVALWIASSAIASAQTGAKPAPKQLPAKKYCQAQGGFCFRYPSTGEMLGEILGGNGIVVAPAQSQAREDWDEVTVALVMPAPQGDEAAVSIDQAIARAVSQVRESGQGLETMQRQQRRVDEKPAELLKVRYTDKNSGQKWVEELVFIEGPDSEIYSVGLKCAPSSLARMEPQFSKIVESWTLPEAKPVPPDEKSQNPIPPKS